MIQTIRLVVCPVSAQLTARFPFGMLSLAFLLHIERDDSYGAAGLVLGAMSIGQAIAGPMTSRLMGVLGMRGDRRDHRALLRRRRRHRAAAAHRPWYMAVAFFAGLSMPPIQPAVRTIYPKMVNSRQLTPLFSLDASAQEIIWIAGPVAITFVSTQIGTVEGILMSVAIMLVGGGSGSSRRPRSGRVRIPRSKRRFGIVLRAASGAARDRRRLPAHRRRALPIEAGVVAIFGDGGADAGIVLAIWSLGLARRWPRASATSPIGPWATARRMLIVFVGVAISIVHAVRRGGRLSLTLIIAGLGIAPALAVLFAIVSASVKFSDTAEAYGWVGTGQLIGAALGSALAGFLIDAVGPSARSGPRARSPSSASSSRRWLQRLHPDLRGRDASPIPDTEPVPVQPS